jgi:hypothetical protein
LYYRESESESERERERERGGSGKRSGKQAKEREKEREKFKIQNGEREREEGQMAVSLVTVIFWDSFLDCDSLKVKKKAVHCTGLSICRFISPNQKAHFVLLGFHRFHSSLYLALFHRMPL